MLRGREAVQKHYLGRPGLASAAMENLQTFDFDRFEQHRLRSVPD